MTDYPETSIHVALIRRVQALALSPTPTRAYPGKEFTEKGDTYIRVTQLRNQPERLVLSGPSPARRMGFMQLDLFTPLDQYEAKALKRAERIANHFESTPNLTEDSVKLRIYTTHVMSARSDGQHWMTPVRIEYLSLS